MNQFIDIILLALLAFAIGIKVFYTLGQNRENTHEVPLDNLDRKKSPKKQNDSEILLNKELSNEEKIKAYDPKFDEKIFLNNAKNALTMIYEAYANGKTEVLSDLLNINMMRAFAFNISKIEEKEYSTEISIVKIINSSITSLIFEKTNAIIKIKFDSEIIESLTDKNHKIIAGHKNRVNKKTIDMEFSRNLKSLDPTWKMINTDYIPFNGDL
jgi:predicted lipid-binding transport protein (Tim44 family)